MEIPNEEMIHRFLKKHPHAREKVLEIAKKLEALKEYNREQALFIATDIVRCRFAKLGAQPLEGTA